MGCMYSQVIIPWIEHSLLRMSMENLSYGMYAYTVFLAVCVVKACMMTFGSYQKSHLGSVVYHILRSFLFAVHFVSSISQ